MKRKKTYTVDVVFTTTVNTVVSAEDVDEAMDIAECEASKFFSEYLENGLYSPSDFDYEAQTP